MAEKIEFKSNINARDLVNAKKNKPNNFQKKFEAYLNNVSPWPISYDVDSTQPINFTEFSYTDVFGGFYLNTQSIEINCRVMEAASKEYCDDWLLFDTLKNSISDKYELRSLSDVKDNLKILYMVGHNMFDMVSSEIMGRLAHEEGLDFCVKLHPLTDYDHTKKIARIVGWNRIVPPNLSGYAFLDKASIVYTTTASEFTMSAVLKGKEIINVSNFYNESSGIYYPISRLLYNSDNPKQILNNILNCPWSGLISQFIQDDAKVRMEKYFEKAFELREKHGTIASVSHLKKIPINP